MTFTSTPGSARSAAARRQQDLATAALNETATQEAVRGLQEPLDEIDTQAEALARGDHGFVNAGQQAVLANIDRRVARLTQMIDSIAGSHAKQTADDVARLIDRIEQQYAPGARRRGLDVAIEIDEQLRTLPESQPIDSVIAQVVENAIACAPAAGQTLVRMERIEAGLRISVTNEGAMASEDHYRMFEPFFPPTGSGQSAARCMVQAHQQQGGVTKPTGDTSVSIIVPFMKALLSA